MADVILFRPNDTITRFASERYPLGLIFLATSLKNKGYDVKIIDTGVTLDWESELKRSIDKSTICVGVTALTGYQIKGGLEFASAVRKIRNIPIIWGGVHPSLLPEETLRNDLVDIVLIGEGEERLPEIVARIKDRSSLNDVKGILYKEGDNIIKTECEDKFLDLNNLSFPAYELVDMNFYRARYTRWMGKKRGYLDLHTDRGCPHRCTFCYNLEYNKKKYRVMSAEKVLDTLEEAKKRYNIGAVNIVSDNFFVYRQRVYDVCKGIIDRKLDINWCSNMKVDSFLRFDDELLRLIERSGCKVLSFGMESGSNRMLERIQKDITAEDILKVHEKIKKYDFFVDYYFMIGFPEETKDDIKDSMRLMLKLRDNKRAIVRKMQTFKPYPGTPLYDKAIEMGFRPPNRLENWSGYNKDGSSMLPWFDRDHKDYIKEVQYFATKSSTALNRKTLINVVIYTILKSYCTLRFVGLINKIRLGLFDMRLLRYLESAVGKILTKRKIARIKKAKTDNVPLLDKEKNSDKECVAKV